MENKYLPLGTVVSINTNNSKIMIIGYYSVEYQNVVKIYDYVGCIYPEGLLLKNSLISFNHNDIKSVEALGYVDDSYKILNNNLNGQQNGPSEDMSTSKLFVNVKFDENGVVVYDELSEIKKNPEIIKRDALVNNPFVEMNATAEHLNVEVPAVNNDYKFDENGIVIEDNSVKEDLKDIESNFKFTFDENGFVIGEENLEANPSAGEEDQDSGAIKYTFDENGIVTGEETVSEHIPVETELKTQYSFSSDGIVTNETLVEMPKMKEEN